MTALQRILVDIESMALEEIPPTPYAVNTAVCVIMDAGATDLIGRAYTGGGGELHVEWRSDTRSLRLTVPSKVGHPSYLYYEDSSNDYGTDDNIDGGNVGKCLEWVASG